MVKILGFPRRAASDAQSPPSSVSSATYSDPKASHDNLRSSNSARRFLSFQESKQQILSFSQPTEAPTGESSAEAPADLIEQLSNLDVREEPRASQEQSSAEVNPHFPFSGGSSQMPICRGRTGVPGGFVDRETGAPSRGAGLLGFSGVPPSSLGQQGGYPTSPAYMPGEPAGFDEGPRFCSPAPEDADMSTTATLFHEAGAQQQKQHHQQLHQHNSWEQGMVELPEKQAKQMHLQATDPVLGAVRIRPQERDVGSSLSTRIGRCIDTLMSICRLSLTVALVAILGGSVSMLCYSLLMDIMLQEQQRQAEAAAAAAACRQRHRDNGCETLNPLPPYLAGPCEEWKACLMSIPEHHGETTKVAAQVVAQVLNAFFHSLHWRTIVAVAAFLWLMIYAYKALHHSLSFPSAPVLATCSSYNYQAPPVQQTLGPSRAPAVAMGQPLLSHQHHLLQDLEHEMRVLRRQIMNGCPQQMLLDTVVRQDMIQRELFYELTTANTQHRGQSLPDYCDANFKSNTRNKRPGFFRALLGSWLFKFLVLLWVVYACAVACMYAVRNNMLQFQLLEMT